MPLSTAGRRAFAVVVAALSAAACASRVPPPGPLLASTIEADVPAIRAAVAAFVVGEAWGDRDVDTLLASGTDFVVDGVVLEHRPRLAGVPGPGTGSVNDLHIQVAGDYAWAVAGYGWVGSDPEGAELGLATFVLQRQSAGWRIRHVHSSHVERWTR
jgi:ketosteroid isomerase-like protein